MFFKNIDYVEFATALLKAYLHPALMYGTLMVYILKFRLIHVTQLMDYSKVQTHHECVQAYV